MAENVTSALPEAEAEVSEDRKILDVLVGNTDAFFLIVIGMIIFLMQCGFAFLEAGSVRTKNTVNILIKNMLDALIGGVSYWAIGWAIAYGPGGNGFIGGSEFFSVGMEYSSYPKWFFQFVFAATAATIVSGTIAERCQFVAYFVYSILITGWVYPPVSHWAWDCDTPGFLCEWGYADFAGSGVVHLLGGVCGLVATILIKPRHGRFDNDGNPLDMPGHSVPLAGLGGFILLFGFLAFNGGSQAAIANEGDAETVARGVVNTILGGCGAGLTVLFLSKFLLGASWSYLLTLNGALTGMVAMCGGCNVYQPWAAIVVGCIGGAAYCCGHSLMLKMKLDDPLDAVAVHGFGGVVGIICVPIFAYGDGVFFVGDTVAPWRTLGINVLGGLIIIVWSTVWSLLIFYPLKLANLYRIDRETEFRGNDMAKHGESAYPADAWVEMQYNKRSDSAVKLDTMAINPVMSGTSGSENETIKGAKYNNAFEMVPTGGKLFQGIAGMQKNMERMTSSDGFTIGPPDSNKQE